MRLLDPAFDLEAFFEQTRRAPARALVLDVDGTLAPFHPDPARVRAYDGVVELLRSLMARPRHRLVLASGRSVLDLARLLPLVPRPELWGSHGMERWLPQSLYVAPPETDGTRLLLDAERRRLAADPRGARYEFKPFGIALHVRGLAAAAAIEQIERARDFWAPLVATGSLQLLEFEAGLELRVVGAHKGTVVETVLREIGPGGSLAFFGDDRTDEDAFAAVRGRQLGVLVRETLRPTAAALWITPPVELLQFLSRWDAAVAEEPACT